MSTSGKRNRKPAARTEEEVALAALDTTDAESAALIRAMLAQDSMENPYADDSYSNSYASSSSTRRSRYDHDNQDEMDDDFVPEDLQNKLKKLQAQQKSPRAKTKKVKPAALTSTPVVTTGDANVEATTASTSFPPAGATSESMNVDDTPSGEDNSPNNSKKRKRSQQQGESSFNTGRWTAEEERKFLEGLELYGRDWGLIQAHVGTRDRNAIRSRAQRHFMKLAKDQQTSTSGEGTNTDSQNALDDSSSAENDQPPASKRAKRASSSDSASKQKSKQKKPFRESDLGVDISSIIYGNQVAPVYEKQRLRDRVTSSWKAIESLENKNPLTLVKAEKYDAGAQPFRVKVHTNALVLADLHCHMAKIEVIGFLAGTWDPEAKLLTVVDAFPCKSIATHDDETNVEMDPVSELEARNMIAARNLRVVGWYHSHPVFPPDPSIRDIQNQLNYQKLFMDEANRCEPFVGIIVGMAGTYDVRMPSNESIINWFYVDSIEAKGQPYFLVSEVLADTDLTEDLKNKAKALLQFYSNFEQRTPFQEFWRYNLTEEQKKLLQEHQARSTGDNAADEAERAKIVEEVANAAKCTKLTKFLCSIKSRLTHIPSVVADEWLKSIKDYIELSW